MKLITALRAEMLKTKRTSSVYFTLIFAAIIPAILLLNVLTGGSDLAAIRKDPLNLLFDMSTERSGLVFFPVFVILLCSLLAQVEYRNNAWKQVFAAPQTKGAVFLAKFINANRLILLFLISNLACIALSVVIINFFEPSLKLFQQPFDAATVLVRTGNAYLTMVALCSFQFWMGLRYRNFIVPTAVGFVLWMIGMMMMLEFQSDVVYYFPYSIQTFPFVSTMQPNMTQVAWTSMAYAVLFLVLGFLDFRRKGLKN